jgi:hypothetical protein
LYVSWSKRLKSSEKREERPLIMFRTLISTRKVVKERVFFRVLRSKTKKIRVSSLLFQLKSTLVTHYQWTPFLFE